MTTRLAVAPLRDMKGSEWDRTVCSLNGNFTHSFSWSRYIGASLGEPVFFHINRASGTAAAGWYTLSGTAVGSRRIMKQAQMESLPCFNPEMIPAHEVFQAVRRLALSEDCVSLSFGNSGPEYLGSLAGCSVTEKTSFLIDLRDPVETICSRFPHQHRKRIRKAVNSGLRVEAFTGRAPQFIESLDAMYRCTWQRHMSAGKSRNPPKETCIREAVSCLVVSGSAVLFVALLGNEPVCFNIVVLFNGTAHGVFQASSEKGYSLSASYLLNRYKIEYFKAHGCRSLGIGEVPREAENRHHPDHGLYLYKSGYTGVTTRLLSGSLVLRPASHAVLSMSRRARSLITGDRLGRKARD